MAAPENPLHKSMRSMGPGTGEVHGREMSSPLPRHRAGLEAASLDAISAVVMSAGRYLCSGVVAPPATLTGDRGRCP